MTQRLKLKIFALILTVVAGASLSSCDDDDMYYNPLVGYWQLVESGGQPVYDYQVDYYTFYSNGSGMYSFYDNYGQFWQEPFYWMDNGYDQLSIQYDNPSFGTVTCYYRYDGRYMYFSTDPSFYYYTVYASGR